MKADFLRVNRMFYGFEIIKDGIFKKTDTVYDLALKSKIFKVNIIGIINPEILMHDIKGKEILKCFRTSRWRESWIVLKDGSTFIDFRSVGGICKGEYMIKTGNSHFRTPKTIGSYFEFNNDIGKLKFSVNRRSLSGKCLVEVKEDFEPLLALGTALILNQILEEQAMIAVTSVATAAV